MAKRRTIQAKAGRGQPAPYTKRGKRPYDYSHLFRDGPENTRANRVAVWTGKAPHDPAPEEE